MEQTEKFIPLAVLSQMSLRSITGQLRLHVPLEVVEDGGQVVVGVVGDARRRDGLEELDGGELGGERSEVLVDERAQGHALLVQVQHDVDSLARLVHLLHQLHAEVSAQSYRGLKSRHF